uniref:Uncharacterized protein n=1 Tax=Acrobeloides nanus TaxID=290746 RepID=A0A914E2W5_9BILA
MRDFVQTCLVKEVKDRPSYDQLAKMDFYTLYSNMADNDARLEKFMEPLILREDKTDEHPDSPSPIAEVDNNP